MDGSICLLRDYWFSSFYSGLKRRATFTYTDSVDPDQMPLSAASDYGLRCLSILFSDSHCKAILDYLTIFQATAMMKMTRATITLTARARVIRYPGHVLTVLSDVTSVQVCPLHIKSFLKLDTSKECGRSEHKTSEGRRTHVDATSSRTFTIGVGRFRILGGQDLEYWGAKGGQNSHLAHDVELTSMRCDDVASTSFRRHVPTRFLINQCQIITFLILKFDNIKNSRIELKGIVFPVPSI